MMNAGTPGTIENLSPNPGINGLLRQPRITVLSHDGNGVITAGLYRGDGSLVCSDTYTSHPISQMFVNGGVTQTTLTPCAGTSSTTYSNSKQQVEMFARYDRVLNSPDVLQIGIAVSRICEKRGRYW